MNELKNFSFIQSWKIQNSGDDPWPPGCYLKCTSHPNETEIPINCTLQPAEETIISVSLVSPSTLGSFQTKWRLCTAYGSYFGGKYYLLPTLKVRICLPFSRYRTFFYFFYRYNVVNSTGNRIRDISLNTTIISNGYTYCK